MFESLGFKTEEVKVHRSVEQTVADLKSSKFVVSDRFHGGVVSHRLNIPFFLTGYQKKNRHFNLETMGGMFAQDDLPSIKKIYEIIELQSRPAHLGQKMKLQLQANEAIEVWSRILMDRLG
jgi:exopolysaccharide biosynthesis predicted pyruvyltransferase EpsI